MAQLRKAVLTGRLPKNAHHADMPEIARELWKMAQEYQRKAAALDSGKLPDIGPAPSFER